MLRPLKMKATQTDWVMIAGVNYGDSLGSGSFVGGDELDAVGAAYSNPSAVQTVLHPSGDGDDGGGSNVRYRKEKVFAQLPWS